MGVWNALPMEPVAMPPGDIVTAEFCGSALALGVPDAAAVPVASPVTTPVASTLAISITLTSVPEIIATRSAASTVASGVGVGSTREVDALDAAGVALYMAGTTAEGVKKPAVRLVKGVGGAESSSGRREGTSESMGAGMRRVWRGFFRGDCVVGIVIRAGRSVRGSSLDDGGVPRVLALEDRKNGEVAKVKVERVPQARISGQQNSKERHAEQTKEGKERNGKERSQDTSQRKNGTKKTRTSRHRMRRRKDQKARQRVGSRDGQGDMSSNLDSVRSGPEEDTGQRLSRLRA